MNICLIPARGGSKRIPRKNIREFRGLPMIAWSIRTAIASDCFDRIIVSTDDDEIACISKDYGAEVPFVRPLSLSSDQASTQAVVSHTLDYLESNRIKCDALCCLYATAPFVRKEDLSLAEQLLKSTQYERVVFTATSFPFPIQRAIKLDQKGYSSCFTLMF